MFSNLSTSTYLLGCDPQDPGISVRSEILEAPIQPWNNRKKAFLKVPWHWEKICDKFQHFSYVLAEEVQFQTCDPPKMFANAQSGFWKEMEIDKFTFIY